MIDIGAVPTPLVYFATYHFNTGCGVAVTGSHNPPDYNGFKIVVGGETLAEGAIQDLYERIAENRLHSDGMGELRRLDVVGEYIDRIADDVQAERPLKVVVDAGNGIAGAIGPQVLQAIGCQVVPLYCDVDGDFPNHHPDPSDPAQPAGPDPLGEEHQCGSWHCLRRRRRSSWRGHPRGRDHLSRTGC